MKGRGPLTRIAQARSDLSPAGEVKKAATAQATPTIIREVAMHYRSLIGAVAVAVLAMPIGGAKAADHAKYPEWKGAWGRYVPRDANVVSPSGLVTPGGQPSFDQTKPWGL